MKNILFNLLTIKPKLINRENIPYMLIADYLIEGKRHIVNNTDLRIKFHFKNIVAISDYICEGLQNNKLTLDQFNYQMQEINTTYNIIKSAFEFEQKAYNDLIKNNPNQKFNAETSTHGICLSIKAKTESDYSNIIETCKIALAKFKNQTPNQ